MNKNRLKAVGVQNALANYIQFGISAFATLLISPILLTHLGAGGFGILRVAQRIVEILTFVDGRIGQYLKIELAKNIGRDAQPKDLSRLTHSASVFTARRVLAIFIIVASGFAFINLQGEPLTVDARYMQFMVPLIIAMLVAAYTSVPEAALTAAGQSYKPAFAQAAGVLFSTVTVFAYLTIGLDSKFVAWGYLVGALAAFSIIWLLASKSLSWYRASFNALNSIENHKELQKRSASVSFWFATEKLLLGYELLIVAYFSGPAIASNFSFSSYIYQTGISVSQLGSSALIPFLTHAIGKGDGKQTIELKMRLRRKVLFVSAAIGLVLIAVNRIFVTTWAGREMHMGWQVDGLLVIGLLQLNLIRCECQIQDAYGNFVHKSLVVLMTIIISFALMLLISNWYQLGVEMILLTSILLKTPAYLLLRWRV